MAKLHFRYGPMGSSKTAQVLMTRFNYIERGRKVLLMKPATDTRDGITTIRSRIGLEADAIVIHKNDEISVYMAKHDADVLIVDESQFLTEEQVIQLRDIVSKYNIPVMCYGLRTDFKGKLFTGSKALFELADDIQEIPSICDCGEKAIINARFDEHGHLITDGNVVDLGGNEKYKAVCWSCYQKLKKGVRS
jgi:thymidine kinase